MPWVDEMRAAVMLGSVLPYRRTDSSAATRALALLPVVGGALGALASVVAWVVSPLGQLAGAAAGVLVLDLLGGRSTAGRTLGARMLVTAATATKIVAVGTLSGPARWVPLVLAPILGRWVTVVQCYGSQPRGATVSGQGMPRAGFREFGVSSVLALGTVLVLLEAVGLLVGLAAAVTAVGLRMVWHARPSGVPVDGARATGAIVEVVVTTLLAGLAAAVA